jgi:hypothetical protein
MKSKIKVTQMSLIIMIAQYIRSSLVAISSTIMRSRISEIWLVRESETMTSIKAVGVELQHTMILKMIQYLNRYKMTILKKRSILKLLN